MTAVVVIETLLLVMLVVLVAGLLRSHAEILRRLGPAEEEPAKLAAPVRRAGTRPGSDLVGVSLRGDALHVGVGSTSPPTLLAFLSTRCSVCERFWAGTPELPADVRLIAVTKAPELENASRIGQLAPPFAVVMSTDAWSQYRVPGSPYFVYLEQGRVLGEGAATDWRQILSLLGDAIGQGVAGDRRASQVDTALAAAGIGPGHPSLYPTAHGEPQDVR